MADLYSPWTVYRPVLIIRNDPAAGRVAGDNECEGTVLPHRHRLPHAAWGFKSASISARIHACQQPRSGFTPTLLSVAPAFHEQEQTTGVVGNVRNPIGEIRNVEC